MPIELKEAGETERVCDADLVPDGDKETFYTLRHVTKEVHRDIVTMNTTKVPNRRTHTRDDVVDWTKVSDDQLDYALVGWEGVLKGGKPLPCTTENKRLLDGPRSAAILDRAGANEVTRAGEARAESFREVEKVR
jgi:hypothetical protein